MRRILAMAAVAAPLLAACSDPGAPELSGQWGGAEVNLKLTASGGVVEYACGYGVIDSGWSLAASGRWRATGAHYSGGGPQPFPGGGMPHPAVYSGQARGAQMTFTVVLPDLPDTLGPFTLIKGRVVTLHYCV